MPLSQIIQRVPPVYENPAPFLARWFTPAGPPTLTEVETEGTAVVSVPGRYCMTHVVEGPDSLVLVDVGSVADIPRIEAAVDWLGKPVSLIIPSHLHFDHIMGIEAAAKHFDARIALSQVAHTFVSKRKRLRFVRGLTFPTAVRVWVWQGAPFFAAEDMPGGFRFGFPWSRNPFESLYDRVIRDGQAVPNLNGWLLLETPGHADDAVCLYNPDGGLLVTGDTVRNYQGGEWNEIMTDPAAYENTIARLEALDVQAIFPGHGPVLVGEGMMRRLHF